ncbi:hypothetical protein ACO0RG_003174 [Hanseniaspora osmophila]|uniref:Exosome complex exonuclease RRP6 n=1 Tax=Hanseniaspora osmophila TaxID=56408 RepID=A0A1E5RF30_9ASCO|nr:Exosome complex exonuclease RRP6 [Hanseniaspora osmophila]
MSTPKREVGGLLTQVTSLVKTTTALANQDIEFHCAVQPAVQDAVETTKERIVGLLNDLFLNIDEQSDAVAFDEGLSINDSWRQVGDALDTVLEKSDKYIDEIKRARNSLISEQNLQYLDDSVNSKLNSTRKRIAKPQLGFATPVDNTETGPFKPRLRAKPHALKSLQDSLVLIPAEEGIPEHYGNPYEYEIMNQEYRSSLLEKSEPIQSTDWSSTSGLWVDSVTTLNSMIESLKAHTEIAVDLEHHSLRSYYGITCLMQISTRDQDYLVDTIALRDNLQELNEVFCNPSITKVLHGAFMDIIWLQRDLGLYVVGLFDTYHASRALGFPKHGLAYLLETFAHFKTSKKYQLADWRVRPLTDPLLAYARSDTHFLLNIFDQLKNMLVEKGKMSEVLYESRGVARRRFEYNKYRPKVMSGNVYCTEERATPWKSLMNNYNIAYELEPLVINLFEWRDTVARREDESPAFVMPNQTLVTLVSAKPVDAAGVLSVSAVVPDYVRTNAKSLANIVKNALKLISSGASAGKSLAMEPVSFSEKSNVVSRETVEYFSTLFASLKKDDLSEIGKLPGAQNLFENASKFFGDSGFWSNDFVSYNTTKKVIVNEQEKEDRKSEMYEAFGADDERLVFEKPPVAAEDVHHFEAPPAEQSKPEIAQVQPQVKENKDDIVVLRSRNVQNQKKPNKHTDTFATDDVIPVDYEKLENVMEASKNSRRAPNKKRSFDPYAVENEGPKAYSKRHKPSAGKNVSFKQKK